MPIILEKELSPADQERLELYLDQEVSNDWYHVADEMAKLMTHSEALREKALAWTS